MSGPPKDVEATELWIKISERPRPSALVDFPGKGADGQPIGQLRMWVLTESEMHTCRGNAERVAKEILRDDAKYGNLGYEEIFHNEMFVEMLVFACRDAKNPIFPVFPTAKAARQKLTTDEIGVLAQAYAEHRRQCGPLISEMTEIEMEAWIKVLTEGGSRLPLASLSSEAKSDLLVAMAVRLSMRTGSPGSPPAEPSTESPAPASDLVDASERATE